MACILLVHMVKSCMLSVHVVKPCMLQGVHGEAGTTVFLGWPGQNEPEEEPLSASLDSNGPVLASPSLSQASAVYQDTLPALSLGPGAISAQMSQDTAKKMSNGPIGSKQLM